MKVHGIVTVNTNLMRLMNKSLVFELIRQEERISRIDIAKRLKLSKSTVSAIVDDLLSNHLVMEMGTGSSTSDGGRKPTHLAFNSKVGHVVGVEVGETFLRLIISDLGGQIAFKSKVEANNRDMEAAKLIDYIEGCIAESHIPSDSIIAVGVAIPGICDIQNRMVLQAPSLNWGKTPLWEMLGQALKKPVYIDNDVNLAALGEKWMGAGKGTDHLVMLSFGTGVGAGIILDGKLSRGHQYSAGEIGYFYDYEDWTRDVTNDITQFGSYEYRTSLHAIRKMVQSELQKENVSSILESACMGDWSRLNYDLLAEAAQSGDETAKRVLDTVTTHIALGISNIISFINPEVIIVGGEIERTEQAYLELIRAKTAKMAPVGVKLRESLLKEEGRALGAISIILQDLNQLLLT